MSVGFDCINNGRMPVIGMFHFAHWYEKHALAYGFEKYIDWFCFMVKKDGVNWEPFFKMRDEMMKKSDIKFIASKKRDIPNRANDVKRIFNAAWEGNKDHLPLTDNQFEHDIRRPEIDYYSRSSPFSRKRMVRPLGSSCPCRTPTPGSRS